MTDSEKLQKVLAKLGLGSRREMEVCIQQGQVKVNDKPATIGDRVVASDKIKFRGKLLKNPLKRAQTTRVVVFHKPVGLICTRKDPEGRKTIFDALPKYQNSRWVMVGRLDINTAGLLLLTNDGELANRLMHPRYEVEREYACRVVGEVDNRTLETLKRGVELDDGKASFETITFSGGTGSNRWYHVTLKEGRNREVRRLWESQGVTVSRLIRVRFANLQLPRYLRIGHSEELNAPMIERLKAMVGL